MKTLPMGIVKAVDRNVSTVKKEFYDACILEVEVGTSSPNGGDWGNGGRTYFKLTDHASTAWNVRADIPKTGKKHIDNWLEPRNIEIVVGGDAEARVFIQALRYAADQLEQQYELNAKEKK